MNQRSGQSTPVWLNSAEFPPLDQLAGSHAEVLIIGGGIEGVSCAYQLARQGTKVLLLDASEVAGGETCRTTAHLASALDDRFTELERLHGEEGSRLAYQSHAQAIDTIEENIRRENIECEFRRLDAYLLLGHGQSDSFLKKEYEAARRAGLVDAEYPATPPLASLAQIPAIRFPRQAQFDPIKYVAGLLAAARSAGARVVTNQFVTSVEEKAFGIEVHLEKGGTLTADYCIVATNAPIVSLTMQIKQAPYRTYAIAVEAPSDMPQALFWDTEDPYHYVRLQHPSDEQGNEPNLLIIGGEDHKTGLDHEPAHRFDALRSWAETRFPGLGAVRYEWSGQVMEPVDALGFIGRAPGCNNLFVVTGDSGMGMTHATIASTLIPDLIARRTNPYEELYDPARISPRSIGTFIKENLTGVAQLSKHLANGMFTHPENIPEGKGGIVREGMKKVACYHEPGGGFIKLSPVCTHLGCEVEWNDLEKSWDCPCHGSRFRKDGSVIVGPATDPLPKVDSPARSH